jgi:hypothetical protein
MIRIVLFALVIWMLLTPFVNWSRRDGKARGIPGSLLAVALLLTFPLGVLVWLLLRDFLAPRKYPGNGDFAPRL